MRKRSYVSLLVYIALLGICFGLFSVLVVAYGRAGSGRHVASGVAPLVIRP